MQDKMLNIPSLYLIWLVSGALRFLLTFKENHIYIYILEKFMKSNMNNMNIPLFIFIIKKGMYHNRQIYQDLILILYRTIFF